MKLFKEGQLVLVIWLDAVSTEAWGPRSEAVTPPAEIHTVGFCVEHTKEHIVVAQNHDLQNDHVSMTMTVSAGMQKAIRRLNEKSSPKRSKRKRIICAD